MVEPIRDQEQAIADALLAEQDNAPHADVPQIHLRSHVIPSSSTRSLSTIDRCGRLRPRLSRCSRHRIVLPISLSRLGS